MFTIKQASSNTGVLVLTRDTFTHFGHKNFLKNPTLTLNHIYFLSPDTVSEICEGRIREKLKKVNFRPKSNPFPPFRA